MKEAHEKGTRVMRTLFYEFPGGRGIMGLGNGAPL